MASSGSQFQGRLAATVEQFAKATLQEASRKATGIDLDGQIQMLRTSPIVGAAYESVVLMALAEFKTEETAGRQQIVYSHPSGEISDWVSGQFSEMQGTLALSISEMLSAIALGDSFAEISVLNNGGEWGLESISIVDPRRWTFEGRLGQYENIKYRSAAGTEIKIPYAKGIHIRNHPHLRLGDTYSPSNAQRAYPAYQAWLIILSESVIAGERQATPLLAGYAPSEDRVPLLDANGEHVKDSDGQLVFITAPEAMQGALENIENQSVIATDIKNKIEVLGQTVTPQFFDFLLKYLERMQLQSFLVPETAFAVGDGGLGNAGLADAHMGLLQKSVHQIVNQIKGALIESVVRPLITWNFGEQDEGYGAFPSPEKSEIDVNIAQVIANGISQGVFSSQDLEVINRMRETLGVPPADEIMGFSQFAAGNADYWQAQK